MATSSPAPSPARKPAQSTSSLSAFAAELGSTKGLDPIPPDQYLYFLGKPEPPLQRLLALVRSLTIRHRHWSPYCIDADGKELRLTDLERLLEMDHGNFMRAVREAKGRGLIRMGSDDVGKNRNLHNSRHHNRVFLCGSVQESTGYDGGEEKGGVSADTEQKAKPPWLRLSGSQRAQVEKWPVSRQLQFYTDIEAAVTQIFQTYEVPQANKRAVSAQTRVGADTQDVSAPISNLVSALPTPPPAIFISSDNYQMEENSSSSSPLVVQPSAETTMLTSFLPITEADAQTLLDRTRAITPSLTAREVKHLAMRMWRDSRHAKNIVGLLLARLHFRAVGTLLETARHDAAVEIDILLREALQALALRDEDFFDPVQRDQLRDQARRTLAELNRETETQNSIGGKT